MRVDQKPTLGASTGTAAATGTVAPRRGVSGQRFALAEQGGAGKASAASASAPLATLDALLALQGEGDPAERRRKSLKRGHAMLDGLDRLKAALLGGRVPADELARLAASVAEQRDASGDPGLDQVLAHVELRARVELAKLGR